MSFFCSVPLLVLVVVLYFALEMIAPGASVKVALALDLPSGGRLELRAGDLMVAFGLVLLYGEIFKSTRTSTASILDHAFSMGLFVVCLLLFLLTPKAGTGAFFLITVMTLLDVLAGFTVTISSARRDVDVATLH